MKIQSNTVETLAQKFPRLPKGIIKKVSEVTGYDKSTISQVKTGARYNPEIFAELVVQLEKYTALKEDLSKRVKKL